MTIESPGDYACISCARPFRVAAEPATAVQASPQIHPSITERLEKRRPKTQWPAYALLIAGVSVIGVLVVHPSGRDSQASDEAAQTQKLHREIDVKAYSASRLTKSAISAFLKSPKTAQFELGVKYTPRTLPAYYIVTGEVHAQNSFSALIRNDVYAVYKFDGESVECIRLHLADNVLVDKSDSLLPQAIEKASWVNL